MSKKHEFKFDLLSSLQDDVIDKNTRKRIKLLMALEKRPNRKPLWITLGSVAAVLALFIGLFALFTKQVPIYTGMTVSRTAPVSASALPSADGDDTVQFLTLSQRFAHAPSNPHHGGDFSGDHSGKQDDIDQSDPFKKGEGDAIEEEIRDSLSVVGGAKSIYYANPNETVYITVHIENPDDFEILSFTLNGVKYASYMFEPGSDLENLILKVDIGEVEGIQQYTIDAIKYVDGTAIKDVRMDGDRTVCIGVSTDKQPTVTVEDEVIGFNDISFSVTCQDPLNLISLSSGKLFAVLYDGETLLKTVELTLDKKNKVTIEGLATNSLYQYAIVASYDALDGTGHNPYTLAQKAFCTKAIVLFDGVSIASESLSFALHWDAEFKKQSLTDLSLYLGNEKVRDLDVDATTVTDLQSDTDYTLVASYKNGVKTETITLQFHTAKKVTPEIGFTSPAKTQTSIGFEIVENDPDAVGVLTKLELLLGSAVVQDASLDTRSFDGLLSDNLYTVRLTYIYDLNDGTGAHTVVKTVQIKTEAKTAPTVSITQTNVTQTGFSFDLSMTDPDAIGSFTKLELLLGEVVVNEASVEARAFDGLLSDNVYTVRATYVYDLNDGKGIHTKTIDLMVHTIAKTAPTVSLRETDLSQTDLAFDYSMTDPDAIGSILRFDLRDATGAVIASNLPTEELRFTDLSAASEYTVVAVYSYDLNDGEGIHEKEATLRVVTDAQVSIQSAIVHTKQIFPNESVTVQLALYSPHNVTFTGVTINGVSTSLKNMGNFYLAQFVPSVQSGVFAVEIDSLQYTVLGAEKTEGIAYETGETVMVFGELEVESVTLSNGRNYAYAEESVTGLITFRGSEAYTVKSIGIYLDEERYPLTKVNDTQYAFEPLFHNSPYPITSVTYAIGDSEKTLALEDVSFQFYRYGSMYQTEISTPQQLMSMDPNGSYILTRDIDMAGISWTPYAFNGFLDGNGYKIKNLVLTGSMFTKANGILANVTLDNVSYGVYIANLTEYHLFDLISQEAYGTYINCVANAEMNIHIDTINMPSSYSDIRLFIVSASNFTYNGTVHVTISQVKNSCNDDIIKISLEGDYNGSLTAVKKQVSWSDYIWEEHLSTVMNGNGLS